MAFFVFITALLNYSFAQDYSSNFKEFASQIEPTDSIEIDTKYKNGVQKVQGKRIRYEYGNYVYEYSIGKWIEYYRNGNVSNEIEYDSFGNMLVYKWFSNDDGALMFESKTIKIDTKAKTLKDFLNPKKYFEILTYNKKYDYSFKECKWYLRCEGQMLNNTKIGTWKKYHKNGQLKKEVLH